MKRLNVFMVPVLASLAFGVAGTGHAQDQQQGYPPPQQYPQQRQYPQQQYPPAQNPQDPSAYPQQPGYGQRWDWNNEDSERQFRSFDTFLHDHPYISKKLWERPSRVNDPGFVNGNKEFRQWLDDHPMAAGTFRADPDEFMERERHFQIYGADFDSGDRGRAEFARFDWFLDGHPEVRRDLMHKPDLVNNRGYLDHHPELRRFLEAHPALATELQDHPRQFMDRESRYEHVSSMY